MNALNDELFAELGTSWYRLDAIAFDRFSKARARNAQERAALVLAAEFDPDAKPLIKDPRMSRLLPLWQPVLAKSAAQTAYLITFRSPLEVANSLAKRNEFDVEQGYLLWARYYLDAEFHTRGLPRAIVDYADLIGDWRATLRRLAAVGIAVDPAIEAEVADYISAELRHHKSAEEQVSIDLEHFPLVQRTYRALVDWRGGAPGSDPDQEALNQVRAQFDQLGGMLSRVVENARADRKRLASARSRADSLAAEVQQAHRAADDVAAIRTAQSKLEQRLDSAVASLTRAFEERIALEQALLQAKAETDRERAAHEQALLQARAEADRERAAIEQALSHAQTEAEAQRIALEQTQVAVHRAAADHARIVEELRQMAGELESERTSLSTELKDVKRKYRSTQHQLARDREKLRRTQERVGELEAALQRMRQTALWRGYTALQAATSKSEAALRRLFGSSPRKRLAERAEVVRNSPLFDAAWYVARYPDVAAAGIDPVVHYLENGWKEGRDPSSSFSTASYLRLNGDVAAAGLNPLLHFIEFGYSEGRSLPDNKPLPSWPSVAANEEFGPASPCASFALPAREPIRWRRAFRLSEHDGELLRVAGLPIGFIRNASQKRMLEAAFNRLAGLSGASKPALDGTTERFVDGAQLLDAWYVSNGRLRSRWTVDQPTVVRAYQHDPGNGGSLSLVGEGLALSAVDFVDSNLANPYFPLLFVLAEPDGGVRSVELIAFPTLCRGGLHYPELLALARVRHAAETAPIDIAATNEVLAKRLLAVVEGTARPFVAKIAVDLSGADGAEPLFQPDLQTWLSAVMRIGLAPVNANAADPASEFLGAAARVAAPARKGGGKLVLPADTIPTISALVMHSRDAGTDERVDLPLLIAGADPAQPALLVQLPQGATAAVNGSAPDFPAAWPRVEMVKRAAPAENLAAAAIRRPRRAAPTESELLVPVAPPALHLRPAGRAITWLVFPEDWDDEIFAQGMEALAQQECRALALVGDVQPLDASLAASLFEDRVHSFPDLMTALDAIETPLVGYLGPHIVLHDARTSQLLSALVDDAGAVTASCVLLSSARRGKGWAVSVADPGSFPAMGGEEHRLTVLSQHAQLFWRTTYPLLRPPRDLWVARTASVRRWLERAGPLRPEEGVQLCTSLVTASYAGDRRDGAPHLQPPAAADVQTIRSEALFG